MHSFVEQVPRFAVRAGTQDAEPASTASFELIKFRRWRYATPSSSHLFGSALVALVKAAKAKIWPILITAMSSISSE